MKGQEKSKKQKKTKSKQSDGEHRHHNTNVHSSYHGIFTIFQFHNALSYTSDEEELIKMLLTSRSLVRISPTRSKNAQVVSWWKGSSKSNTSSFHSMMFEDNVGKDGLSAQSSYIINISDSNYIENLSPDPDMFDNEVVLEHDTLQKVYTKLIEALNEVQI